MYYFYTILFFYFLFKLFYSYNKHFDNIDKFVSFIFTKVLLLCGYKINIIDFEKLPSKLIIIGSHTSIYDFLIGVLFYYAIFHEKYSTYVFMKNSFEIICKPILIFFDKKFKFISVDTNKKNKEYDKNKNGLTTQICDKLKNEDNYVIFISPEGTRKCTEKIKSGYWYIAKNLDIDILYLGIDYSLKTITMEDYRKPYNTWEEEEKYFIDSCIKYIPLYPERCFWTKKYYENNSK
jgi:1-acyl-sn-glycerol-3-phosphate acyltransferase